MKKIVSLLLCFLIVLGVIPVISLPTAKAAGTKLVAITFDDGPGAYTNTLLDGLKSRGAKATFFLVGNRIGGNTATIKRMLSEGHQIGNHSYSHPDLNSLSAAGVNTELTRTRNLLVGIGGERTYALRPPYGNHNSNVRSYANGPVILWSVDTLDWKSRNANSVYNKIMNETTDGSIVLLHDIYSTSVEGALRAIDSLQEKGYECVTINELFRRRAVTLENGKVYTAAYNKGITLPAADAPKAPTYKTGDVFGGKTVTLSCATKDAQIYYTLDGSKPTDKSIRYSKAFTIESTKRLRAVAYKDGYGGAELDKTITLTKSSAPTITYADGVATLRAVSGTLLYYTTDKTLPTNKSTKYTGPVTVGKRLNVRVSSVGKEDRMISYTFTKYGDILTDVPANAWYYGAVGEAMHRGIMNGVGDMEFAPEGEVTRAMFVTALHRMSPDFETKYPAADFTDVKKGKWYSSAVAWAQSEGIVKGMSQTQYCPDEKITREQMCVMLGRYLKRYEYQLPQTERTAFADGQEIASWAKKDVTALYEMGLINGMGDDKFCPKNHATRAQCAKLLIDLDTKV